MKKNSNTKLNKLIPYYLNRINNDKKNIERIKKFYNDDESFNKLMNKLIEKDAKRFEKHVNNITKNQNKKFFPTPWKVFFVIIEIVQNEGKEIKPFDTLTKMLPSRSLLYYGWTFSWVHGKGTIISIFNKNDELVYRF